MHKLLFALANVDPQHRLVACANEFHVIDPDKPLRIPYGDYPFGTHKMPDGSTLFLYQRFDRVAADAWKVAIANELASGGLGLPIYHGHPDVPELAAKYPDKRSHGWGNRMENDDQGADIYVAWNEAPGKSFAYFSPYWMGPLVERKGMTGIVHAVIGASIGLTNTPNIREFRLPNESAATTEEPQMNELIAFLKLDPASTPADVLAAVKKLSEDNTALKGAADAAKAEATTATTEKGAAEVACANERKARIDLLLSGALADGRVTPAGKPAWQSNLEKDFAAFSVALANEKPAMKTESVTASRKPGAADLTAQGKIIALVNEAKATGLSHDAAFALVKSKNPALFALTA